MWANNSYIQMCLARQCRSADHWSSIDSISDLTTVWCQVYRHRTHYTVWLWYSRVHDACLPSVWRVPIAGWGPDWSGYNGPHVVPWHLSPARTPRHCHLQQEDDDRRLLLHRRNEADWGSVSRKSLWKWQFYWFPTRLNFTASYSILP